MLDHCQHWRRINSVGINRIAADTWGTIYPKLLPPLQIAGKDDGPIQHQHTFRQGQSAVVGATNLTA